MSTLTKAKKPARKPVPGRRAKSNLLGIIAAPGNVFAGLEKYIGCVSIGVPQSSAARRALIRARIRADHNT